MEDRFKRKIWDNIEKKYVKNTAMSNDTFIFFDDEWENPEYYSFDDNCSSNRYTIIPCLGLKDKNGKLIYEGNRMLQYDSYGNNTGNTGTVEFNELQARWWIRDDQQNTVDIQEPLCKFRAGFYEIIGDKYENPELIEN